jgi:hypothetical protein
MSEPAKEDSTNFYDELRKEMREKQQAETERQQKPVNDLFNQLKDQTIDRLKGENK